MENHDHISLGQAVNRIREPIDDFDSLYRNTEVIQPSKKQPISAKRKSSYNQTGQKLSGFSAAGLIESAMLTGTTSTSKNTSNHSNKSKFKPNDPKTTSIDSFKK